MKLIAGLGNPGARYRGSRHNVGFEVVDELIRRHGLLLESAPADALMVKVPGARPTLLVKPLTRMNRSGRAVADLTRYYRISPGALLVVVDDVNLELGRLRARARGSEGGHNGLRSIIECLGTDAFARLRVGVGRGDRRRDLADHVLSRFEPDERGEVDRAVSKAADAVELFLAEGIEAVMSRYNRRDDPGAGEEDDAS